mmetsp:Transcript_23809/g.49823  ORF Transcript_23809/g.49823 Transcript_23809/m.49823 type:complete len:123 (-) Transcript_23809:916-1284(-)
MPYVSSGRSKRSFPITIVLYCIGSSAVQTDNTMMFKNSKAIIGFITSRAVNVMRLNLDALRIICFIRDVLVNSALNVSDHPTANNQGGAMQAMSDPIWWTSENSNVRGIIEVPISKVPEEII